jgi:transcriptional regulator with XRE-family HTH domain
VTKTVSDQLRDAIRGARVSRYRIAKETGVEESALSRFVNGTRSLDLSSVDKLAAYLGLELRLTIQNGKGG